MTYEFISVSETNRVVRVTLNRPAVRNAFNRRVIDELTDWAVTARENRPIRAAILAGAGKVFCAGADVDWLSGTMGYTREQHLDDARALQTMLRTLDTLPFALIARVHGAAIAGGVGLISVCDIVVSADDAVFAVTEAKLGIVPAIISAFVLSKIGVAAARSAFTTGMRFSAQQAYDIGLVHAVVPIADLDATVERYVGEVLTCGPEAVAAAKALIRNVSGLSPEEAAPLTAEIIAERRASAEGQAGMRAFLEKKTPPWID